MKRYAEICRLGRRPILTLPLLTPSLASHWVGLVTPVLAGVARPLVGSLIHDAVCDDDDVIGLLGEPPGGRTPFDVAVERATSNLDAHLWRRTLMQVAGMVAACAVAGSLLTDPDSRWYRNLSTPGWQPPTSAFPVVWTSLYAALTVTSAATITELIEQGRADEATAYRRALLVNLTLNTAWSALFWRARRPWLATLDSAALAVSSVDLARRAGTVGRGKRAVLLGYAGWSGFATVLGGTIARRNRARKR
jgi:tryptophan-rich sensory protein